MSPQSGNGETPVIAAPLAEVAPPQAEPQAEPVAVNDPCKAHAPTAAPPGMFASAAGHTGGVAASKPGGLSQRKPPPPPAASGQTGDVARVPGDHAALAHEDGGVLHYADDVVSFSLPRMGRPLTFPAGHPSLHPPSHFADGSYRTAAAATSASPFASSPCARNYSQDPFWAVRRPAKLS